MYYVDTDETKALSQKKFSFTENGTITTSLNYKKDGELKAIINITESTIINNIPLGETTLYLANGTNNSNA